jgi:hypothetical protein
LPKSVKGLRVAVLRAANEGLVIKQVGIFHAAAGTNQRPANLVEL